MAEGTQNFATQSKFWIHIHEREKKIRFSYVHQAKMTTRDNIGNLIRLINQFNAQNKR